MVAQVFEALHRLRVHAGFDIDLQTLVEAPARRVAGGLGVLLVVEHAHHGLHMALGLHIAAHHAKAHHRLTILCQKGRDDGVKRALARRDQVGLVRCVGGHGEAMAAVLQADAVGGLDATRTKAHVIALDEADHHAVFVGRGEVNRAALDRVARAKSLGALHVDQLGALGQVGVVQHLLGADLHALALGHESVDIGKGQFHGFNLQVLRRHAIDGQAGQIEVFQNAQSNLGGDALAIGRDFMQGVLAVIFRQRRDPLGLELGKVAHLVAAAVVSRKARQGLGNFATIKRLALGLRDQTQAARCRWKFEQLTHLGGTAPGQKALGKSGQRLQLGGGRFPLLLHHHRQQISPFSDLDGRLQQILKRQLAKTLAQGDPGRHRTRDGDRIHAALGRRGGRCAVFGLKVARCPGLGRRA